MNRSGEHCLHLRRSLLPHAKRSLDKARKDIESVLPNYFQTFDASAETAAALQEEDCFALLCRFVAFVENTNFYDSRNAARMALPVPVRLNLHQEEARVLHNLKSHIELLEAYRWHQISARRQEKSLQNLRDGGLPPEGLLVQIDFKENVRYPLRRLVGLRITLLLFLM